MDKLERLCRSYIYVAVRWLFLGRRGFWTIGVIRFLIILGGAIVGMLYV